MSFHEKFEQFREDFSKDRGLIMATNSVNSKANSDLKKLYLEYLNSLYLSNRIHYVAFSNTDISITSLEFILKGVKPMSVSASLKVFAKPNHKDRFAYLMFWLRSNPEIFAQVVYFYLISSTVDPNDKEFFIYNTLPVIYSNFSTVEEQTSVVQFIQSLFDVHEELHGENYSKSHQFIGDICMSFFIATNPGHFFGIVLKPLLRSFADEVDHEKLNYTLVDGKLIRGKYWEKCLEFGGRMLDRMIQCITLLPAPARYFLTKISNNKNRSAIVFESLFCQYLRNPILSNESVLLTDICLAIRCLYPQDFLPSKLYPLLSKSEVFSKVKPLSSFFEAAKLETLSSSDDSLSKAVSMCDRATLFSPRDLSIIYEMSSYFAKEIEDDEVKQFVDAVNGISAPNTRDDDKVLLIKTWSSGGEKEKAELKSTKTYDDIIDGLSILNSNQMKYSTGKELADSSLLYGGSFMNWMQRLRISTNVPSVTAEDLSTALNDVHDNEHSLNRLSQLLFSAIYFITTDKDLHDQQSLRDVNSLVLQKFLPLMKSTYPKEFDFTCKDFFQARDNIPLVFKALNNRIKPMKLPPKHELMISRALFGEFFDALESVLGFQAASVKKSMEITMENYCKQNEALGSSLSKTHKALIDQAKYLFKLVDVHNAPTQNLELVKDGMRLLKNFSEDILILSIAQTKSIGILAFNIFIRTYVKDDDIKALMFDEDELKLMNAFVSAGTKIR